MGFEAVLKRFFPSAVYTEAEYVERTCLWLAEAGFNASNSIAFVGLCRDELAQGLVRLLRERWVEPFNLSSLAGMFFAGRTALVAGLQHTPDLDGRSRFVYYSMSHIAIDAEGRLGMCRRTGMRGDTVACGALDAFQREFVRTGRVSDAMDNKDAEQSLLRKRLGEEMILKHMPSLLELANAVRRAAQRDIEAALSLLVDVNACDHAFLSGIQVHGPAGNYIWPASCYAIVKGEKRELPLHTEAS